MVAVDSVAPVGDTEEVPAVRAGLAVPEASVGTEALAVPVGTVLLPDRQWAALGTASVVGVTDRHRPADPMAAAAACFR